jgi:NitT/TauT family transport system permease protein
LSALPLNSRKLAPAYALVIAESFWGRVILIITAHFALLLGWYLAVVIFEIRPFLLPTPFSMLDRLAQPHYAWGYNTAITAAEIVIGFGMATLVGISLALFFSWSPLLTLLVFPLLITLNMIPKVALGPLIIMWLRYGIESNSVITFTLCVFPIVLTTYRGLRETEPDLLDLMRSLKAKRLQIFLKLQLPGALPYVFSGMKVATILAVAGAIVGEFIASDSGLGYLMIQAQSSFDTPAMFASILLLTILGVAVYLVVMLLELLVIPKDARVE